MSTAHTTHVGIIRRTKRLLAGIIFWVMGRGLVACARLDSRVRDEVATWPDGSVITLMMWPGTPKTSVRKFDGRLTALGSRDIEATLRVTFKSVAASVPVLLGMKAILQAFAEHRATVRGDLGLAMSLVRCLHIVEGYLYPDIMTRRILPSPATRQAGHLRAYAGLLGASAPIAPAETTRGDAA
ncbi:MAG: hypothetical protein KJ747_03120 [Actinobacteria bacterium]|nr:hypothetical protein [Actinomycetota bacterium]MCG2808269.1 hypothetical protein [Coriobacteriia bacterium]